MIINVSDSNTYSIIFDTNDLNKYNINVFSLCGNPLKLKSFLNNFLKNNLSIHTHSINNIKFLSFQFKIFKITFSIF